MQPTDECRPGEGGKGSTGIASRGGRTRIVRLRRGPRNLSTIDWPVCRLDGRPYPPPPSATGLCFDCWQWLAGRAA